MWRKLRADELSGMYFSLYIVRVIKSRRMRWAVHVARMGERRGVCMFLVGKPEGDPGVNGRITLRSIFRKWDVGTWTESGWLREGKCGGHL
jgi:hypothetical protein